MLHGSLEQGDTDGEIDGDAVGCGVGVVDGLCEGSSVVRVVDVSVVVVGSAHLCVPT